MPKIRVNDVQYYYRRRGIGPPLVLLHGFSGSSFSWATLTDALAQRMDIITIDLLGHGHTGSPQSADRYAIEYAAQDITAIVDHLGFDRFSLLGYSMGGRLALYLAHRFPELTKALILESASPGLKTKAEREERRQRDNALADRIEQDGIGSFVDFW